jgi:hypothetical protein
VVDGSICRCHRSPGAISLPPVWQMVLPIVVVSQSICKKVRSLRPAKMGELRDAEFKLRHYRIRLSAITI